MNWLMHNNEIKERINRKTKKIPDSKKVISKPIDSEENNYSKHELIERSILFM